MKPKAREGGFASAGQTVTELPKVPGLASNSAPTPPAEAPPLVSSSSSNEIDPLVAEYMERFGMDRDKAEEWARFI